MSVWVRLTMLAWVTAVLAVAPVQAALACRTCCVKSAATSAAKPAAHRSCCAHHQTSASCSLAKGPTKVSPPAGRPCHECPHCEQARPLPVAPIPAGPQLSDLAAIAVFDVPAADSSLAMSCPTGAVDSFAPVPSSVQRCAQLCRWLT
ncbi:MAG TPA: hypothetical protein VFG20_19510 [Planctomycetaceae bacterium]|jgi:hypothetical protein|nr:hypothetical protein [Planctomycetaceae bacterium]